MFARFGRYGLLGLLLIASIGCREKKPASSEVTDTPVPKESVVCYANHWCWDEPRPLGIALADAWPVGPHELWAVGPYGTVVRWDGTIWSPAPDPTDVLTPSDWLTAIHASRPDNVWAVSGGYGDLTGFAFLHWNGFSWERWTHDNTHVAIHPTAVWTDGPNNVWIGGSLESFSPSVSCVVHFDGTTWEDASALQTELGKIESVNAFWRAPDGTLWAGTNAGMRAWDEAVKSWRPTPYAESSVTAIWGIGDEAWASGDVAQHYYNGVWATLGPDAPGSTQDVWGVSANDLWFLRRNLEAGPPMELVHWRGATYSTQPVDASWVSGSSATDAWAGGDASVLQLKGDEWQDFAKMDRTAPAQHNYVATWAADRQNVWALSSEVRRWNGKQWSDARNDVAGARAIHGSGPEDIWIVGDDGLTLHFNGKDWIEQKVHPAWDLNGVWAAASNDVWAISPTERTYHWEGHQWIQIENRFATGRGELRGIWSGGKDDVLAIGTAGLLGYDGTVWNEVTDSTFDAPDATTELHFLALSGSPEREPWLLTTTGLFRRVEGAWQKVEAAGTADLVTFANSGDVRATITVDTANSAWLVLTRDEDLEQAVFRWDGTELTRSRLPIRISGIAGVGAEHAWAVGTDNAILRYRP